jgi:tetraacyldisaccharide 4'-kinase
MRAPDFWQGRDYTARLASALLAPVGALYGASVAWKRNRAKPHRAQAKVVCIGNLTVGGTGKTPIAIAIAGMLSRRRLKTVFLSRGYGGKTRGPIVVNPDLDAAVQVGDEPLLLANAAPTIVSRDRRRGAELADANGAGVIVMDDGHQNFALTKDLSLIVVDAEAGFGNGRIVPAGPLREPVRQGLARADAVIVAGEGSPPLDGFAGPVLRARLAPAMDSDLRGKDLVAFAGIGRPEKFFDTLRDLGANLIEATPFADHYDYTASELARLKARARDSGAMLVTTEKDFVRLPAASREGLRALPVTAQFDDIAALERLLDRIAAPAIARDTDD